MKVFEFKVTVLFDETEGDEASGIHDVLTDELVNGAGWVDAILHISYTDPSEREYVKDEFASEGWPDEVLFGDLEGEE